MKIKTVTYLILVSVTIFVCVISFFTRTVYYTDSYGDMCSIKTMVDVHQGDSIALVQIDEIDMRSFTLQTSGTDYELVKFNSVPQTKREGDILKIVLVERFVADSVIR